MSKDIYLPRDFHELVKAGDFEILKEVFNVCDINASEIISQKPALSYTCISNAFAKWLIQNGADVNAVTNEQQNPLHLQTMQKRTDLDVLKTLIEHGANVNALDRHGNTPLHYALDPKRVQLLLAHGANPLIENKYGELPLETIFSRYGGFSNIIELTETSEILLNEGNIITEKMKTESDKICSNAEKYQSSYQNDNIDLLTVHESIVKLKQLFDVVPVADKYRFENLPEMIQLNSSGFDAQFDELWALLVPKNGHASSTQGEIIRISGRIGYEILSNGGLNWDKDYQKMLDFFNKTMKTGVALEKKDIERVKLLSKNISALYNIDQKEIDELCQFGIDWILRNPKPTPLSNVKYKR